MKTPAPENVNMFHTLCAGMSSEEKDVLIAAFYEESEDFKEKYLESKNWRADLVNELAATRDELKATRDELKATRDELKATKNELAEARNLITEKNNIISDIRKAYNELEGKCNAFENENKELKEALEHVSGNFDRAQQARFGQKSEQLQNLDKGSPVKEHVDEDENTGEDVNLQQASGTDSGNGQNDGSSKPKHKGGKGKAARDFSGIQFVDGYDYDTEKLLEKYGPDARVVRDNTSISVIYIRAHFVVVVKHRPTIAYSSGPDTKMVTVRSKPSLWLNSYATPSLVAHIIYERFFLCITYCRIEKEFADLGFTLGRQTMSSWLIRVAFDFLKPVWEHLKNRLLKQPYNQCDETTEEVINDGRKAGSTSFVWFHSSSELYAKPFTPGEPCLNPPIIWVCFELTRGTDHLRATYKGYKGIITCDGYGAYKLLEKESQEDGGSQGIHTSGCMMHMRRRFASSYRMTKPANLSKEASRALPEYKALVLIRDFYIEEGKLKELSPEERKKKRNEKVRPKVDAFYAYIESLDTNDPLMSETLKEAVQYAINQKDSLTLFLDDGNIPIDNGFVERAIRPFTILRRNSLFCTSIEGAEAAAIIYSIVATARANKVRVDVYLEYLLEKVPKTLDAWGKCDDAVMETMMPWSEEYREYEKQHASRPSGPSGVPLWPDMYKEEVADMPDEPIPEVPATPPPQSDAA